MLRRTIAEARLVVDVRKDLDPDLSHQRMSIEVLNSFLRIVVEDPLEDGNPLLSKESVNGGVAGLGFFIFTSFTSWTESGIQQESNDSLLFL